MFKLKFNHVTKHYNSKIKQRSTTKVAKPITKQPKAHTKGKRVYKVALLIPSNHMVNLLLYHHCIRDFIPLVVVSFFKEGHVPSSFTPRSETKDQPMP
jgi:hypothetical protein